MLKTTTTKKEKDKILPLATTWMDPEGIRLSEVRQRKTIPYDFTYIWNLKNKNTNKQNKQTHGYREQTGGRQRGGGGDKFLFLVLFLL